LSVILPLKPVEALTLALGGPTLVGTKGFGQTTPFLLKFSFQDDEEPKLNVGQTCPFRFELSFHFHSHMNHVFYLHIVL
jgi:hypothetical protein